MRIMLLGKNGQLGHALANALPNFFETIPLGREDVNLSDHVKLRETIRRIKPDLIINAAAYTNVEKAEDEKEEAMQVNGVVPEILALEAKSLNAGLVHYSTDYVFDGLKKCPYTEEDKPNPLNTYGYTKMVGENAIQSLDIPYIILRTCWVYSITNINFITKIINLSKEKDIIKVVNDQTGTPTWVKSISNATREIIFKYRENFIDHLKEIRGVYNVADGGCTTWYNLAVKLMDCIRNYDCKIVPISSAEFDSKAKRPKYSVLDTDKIEKLLGIRIHHWSSCLDQCLDEGYSVK